MVAMIISSVALGCGMIYNVINTIREVAKETKKSNN